MKISELLETARFIKGVEIKVMNCSIMQILPFTSTIKINDEDSVLDKKKFETFKNEMEILDNISKVYAFYIENDILYICILLNS